MKDKLAISMDSKLRARVDAIAKENGESRSQVIERLCSERLENEYVEFLRLTALPTEIREYVMSWKLPGRNSPPGHFIHDDDGPIEMVLRTDRRNWEQWMRKRKRNRKERHG